MAARTIIEFGARLVKLRDSKVLWVFGVRHFAFSKNLVNLVDSSMVDYRTYAVSCSILSNCMNNSVDGAALIA